MSTVGPTVTTVTTTILKVEDRWNATSERKIDDQDRVTFVQEFTYSDGTTQTVERTCSAKEFADHYAGGTNQTNKNLDQDIRRVAQGRYGKSIDFSHSLAARFARD